MYRILLRKIPCKTAQSDPAIQNYLDGYQKYRESVKSGHRGKTGQLWISYMDLVRLVMFLIHAIKHNNFLLYAHRMQQMTSLFFSFGGHNYATCRNALSHQTSFITCWQVISDSVDRGSQVYSPTRLPFVIWPGCRQWLADSL